MIIHIKQKGIFTNLCSIWPAVVVSTANTSAKYDGINVANSTFSVLKRTSSQPPAIYVSYYSANINISDSIFTSISSSSRFILAGAIYFNMSTTNGYYNISKNTFFDISTNKSVLVLTGAFSNLTFSYNIFYNVTSTDTTDGGGVFFTLFYFILLLLLLLFCFFILLYFFKYFFIFLFI
jgi:hypothetical protein